MIEERMEELAGLYVLEALTPAEHQEFAAALGRSPELQALVASLRDTRDALAGAVPPAGTAVTTARPVDPHVAALENRLRERLGTKIHLRISLAFGCPGPSRPPRWWWR